MNSIVWIILIILILALIYWLWQGGSMENFKKLKLPETDCECFGKDRCNRCRR